MLNFLFQIVKLILLLIFPFILLIRGAVYFHVSHYASPWVAIVGGLLLTVVILFIYFSFLYGKMSGKFGNKGAIKRRFIIAFLFVFLYAVHGIFYYSGKNLKNPNLKSEITKVHPILRLSVSTVIHLDKSLIITDTNRVPEDYKKMGLKSKKHSLHYVQKNGYAHALDLRTKNRSELRNNLLIYYFKLMGFQTLRHVGTADHLHISLKSHDRPYAI